MENQHAAAYPETSVSFKFEYDRLADASTDIRLLHILPGLDDNGRIRVGMWNVSTKAKSTGNSTSYQCLSYTWGAPDEGHEISLNGRPFLVRHNLLNFLKQAAKTYPLRPLWIDAICIDQGAVQEKNIQVTRMGQIYRRARAVLVWLGNDTSLVPLARFMAHDNSKEHSYEFSQIDRELSYVAFWNHPYWSRTWITQELFMAVSIQVLIDSHTFDWSCIQSVIDLSFHMVHRITVNIDFETKQKFYDLVTTRAEHAALNGQDIWELLRWRQDTECSIIIDRIYALLSLVYNGATFRASYEEEPSALFWRVGHHFQAWSSALHMQRLRVALRLTRHDIARSMKPSGSLVLELRIANADSNLNGPKSTLCGRCGKAIALGHKSDIILCSNLGSTTTEERPTHVLAQRQSLARSIRIGGRIKFVYNYALKVDYDVPADGLRVNLSHRALIYRVGEDWRTSTPEDIESLRPNVGSDVGHNPERWAVFLPPDNVLQRLDAFQGNTKYPWWEERWVDIQ